MKKIIFPVLSLLLAALPLCAAETSPVQTEWNQVPEILTRIVAPTFPARNFVITDFGAVADGKTDCTAAISNAISACAASGGGHVVVPAGEFLTGAIHLKSNVDLHLAATNSVLKFSTDPNAYLPAVFTRFEGIECYNYSPLIFALGQKNIAVTGAGTLDGQADDSNWLAWKGGKGGGETRRPPRANGLTNEQRDVPVEQRRFGEGDFSAARISSSFNAAKMF